MATVIILDSTQAAHVSGPSDEAPTRAALAPVALTDGRYLLGVEVLTDPLHAEDHDYLAALPQADFSTVSSLMPSGKGG